MNSTTSRITPLKVFATLLWLLCLLLYSEVVFAANGFYLERPRKSSILFEDEDIQLKRGQTEHFIIELVINDKPVTLLFDTGSTLTYLKPEVAETLGLKFLQSQTLEINFAPFETGIYRCQNIDVGNVNIQDYDIIAPNLDTFFEKVEQHVKREIDGILGFGFFYNYTMTMKLKYGELTLSQVPLNPFDQHAMSYELVNGVPKLNLTLTDGTHDVTYPFVVDTGFDGFLSMPTENNLPFEVIEKNSVMFSTLEGTQSIEQVAFDGSIELGQAIFGQMIITFSDATSKVRVGRLGNKVLRNFNLQIDQRNQLIKIRR